MARSSYQETPYQRLLRTRVYPWRYALYVITFVYLAVLTTFRMLEDAHWALQVFFIVVMWALFTACYHMYKIKRTYNFARRLKKKPQSLTPNHPELRIRVVRFPDGERTVIEGEVVSSRYHDPHKPQ